MAVSAESSSSIDPAALLARQRSAFVAEGPQSLQQRKARLARLRAVVLAHRRDVEEAVNADFGHRSRHETAIMELVGVVQAIDYLTRHLRRFMKPQRRHVGLFYRAGQAHVEYQPLGVIGVMAPWNYPFALTFIPLATALAAGNRAMLKPSELTPRTSEVMRRMLADTFPSEEVAVVLGGPEVGAAFSGLPFDHLLFTGSTQVGRKVMKAASDNLVPVTLELGGKSPAIVARGHVDGRTMSSIVFGKLSNGGQTCVAPDYALVHEDDLDAFVAQYDAAVARFYPNGPTSPDYTSIVSDRHYDRLKGLVDEARSKGARVIEAGIHPQSAATRKRTLAPTLIVGAGDDTAVMQEEIFGPILPVRTYRTIDEVVDYVNARPRPLALYYFGVRDGDCETVLKRTTSGNVGINNTVLHVAQEDLPFGGVGPSGMGAYHGIEGFRAMSHAKGVFVQGRWSLPSLLRAPFGKLADVSLAALLGRSREPAGGRIEWSAKR
ncbi:MAG: coniferyl aldehyde dehydrogenase [Burkholderia sp.]|jgi:coniferyl-aldehyde dehydrogenase|uniref:coniferyl aldehyde dehydrogenase n=3 Tax=Burkholderia sp. TaxID=36773 RepID=UPI00258BDAF8|nr:coniferyl aldehyde dehydrogenase [Burkholderia sp.]MCA3779425.1 coniferyl aldehyde dehydrogenase [Burkholderia sp.]MCA3796623.1 coniferyl aldehyde dehydrogenase [Burkholderia sp.]MCA3804512.1 coniferyl aldehyde dehydrogenase [Burkholderia sp.]MCA3811631.1 coniferyl aldehyde dehydrogenase [Burkholderia sp.]MCA3820802.1 coniferyl aldehyde dehydrogenase [Burkholderia sp.]